MTNMELAKELYEKIMHTRDHVPEMLATALDDAEERGAKEVWERLALPPEDYRGTSP